MDEIKPQPENPNPSTGTFVSGLLFIWDFLKIVIIALVIIIPVRYFVFQPFIVSGSSMEPNFQNGQYLVIDELTYHFASPVRGQVVVLRYPKNPREFFIKRIVGLPGERIQIDNGKVIIFNTQHPEGIPLDEIYLPNQSLTFPHDVSLVGGQKTLTLGSDEYFVMGDNRLASSDSRDWGMLKQSSIVGKVFLRALPLSAFEVYTKTPSYNF